MNIAILGCGYVGIALAAKLKDDGHHITVTTRSPEKAKSLKAIADDVIIAHGNNSDHLEQLLHNQEILIVCVAADNAASYENTYLDTAKALVKSVPRASKLKKIIYTGSTSVYGEHNGQIVDETTPATPTSPSAQILLQTEQQLLTLQSPQRDVTIFRLGEIIGPGREIADRLRRMNGTPLPGTGENITNLIHVDDIVKATELALNKSLSGIFNLCNDLHITRKELYDSICAQENLPPVTWNTSQKSLHSSNKVVSTTKIKAAGLSFE
jgi:nucleoside-diphosphate-sugar epimerase